MFDYATYSLEDDKLRLYGPRVPKDVFDELRRRGFQRAPKQGCFYTVWSPAAEDFILEHLDEIEDEDTTEEERAEDRSERYETYSENAGKRSTDAFQRARDAVSGIPPGQPVLLDHYSAKSHLAALKRHDNAMRKGLDEADKSSYWKRKAEASLRRVKRKQDPGAIYRRIEKLEAAKRKREREKEPAHHDLLWWRQNFIGDVLDKPRHTNLEDLSDEERERLFAHERETAEKRRAYADRWIAHIEDRLAFERALYEASGGVAADNLPLEKGCFVKAREGWYGPVIRLNKSRGKVVSVSVPSGYSWNDKIRVSWITDVQEPEPEGEPA